MFKKLTSSSSNQTYDKIMEDFPRSEMWRLQTDGWQQAMGPSNFREAFYKGMDIGNNYIKEHCKETVTVGTIENLYQSAYQFENEYQESAVVRKGIRDGGGGFEIFTNMPGVDKDAGVSEAGLAEFVDALIAASTDFSSEQFPRWQVKVKFDNSAEPPKALVLKDNPSKSLNLTKFDTKEELTTYLRTQLRNAALSKTQAKDSASYQGTKVRVDINCPAKYSREEIKEFITQSLDDYYKAIQESKSEEDIVKNIIKLVRNLHQSHCFPDGNGRTFIFLLSNLLLMQNNLSRMIVNTPAHFAGFSTNELYNEIITGQQQFKEYLVTAAKTELMQLDVTKIQKSPHLVDEIFDNKLSKNPMIALAQLNELFLMINNNEITVPAKNIEASFLSLFKEPQDYLSAHNKVLSMIKKRYFDIAANLAVTPQESITKNYFTSSDAFRDILNKHSIMKDNKFTFKIDTNESNMEDALSQLLSQHTYKPQ